MSNGQEAPGKDPDHKQIAINKFTIKENSRHPAICISAVFLIHQGDNSINKHRFINVSHTSVDVCDHWPLKQKGFDLDRNVACD